MKKILIPTNLTLDQLNLIKYGVQMFKGKTCQVFLVHLIPMPDSITDLLLLPREEDRIEKIEPSVKKALDRIKKAFVVEIDKLAVIHMYGDSPIKMADFITDNQIDLVLCPAENCRGEKSPHTVGFGPLFRDATCPVLYVPENAEINRFNKIAYVLDLEDSSPLVLDDLLMRFATKYDYHISFLAVFNPGTDPNKLSKVCQKIYLNDTFKNINCSLHFLQEEDLKKGVCSFIEEYKVDLLVSGKRRKGLKSLFSHKKSLPETINSPSIPMLSIS